MIKRYSFLSIFILCIAMVALFLLGTFWGTQRGAHDYFVFFGAGKHIALGDYLKIYTESSDRFLYAPGFAWIFSFFQNFSNPHTGLWLWNGFKLFLIAIFVYAFFRFYIFIQPNPQKKYLGTLIPLLALLFISRGLLLDFQYGQINLILLLLSAQCLILHISPKVNAHPLFVFFSWFLLALFSFSKLFTLPLLGIPFFSFFISKKKSILSWTSISGVLSGSLLIHLLPLRNVSFKDWIGLNIQWVQGIFSKGVPMDGHNQSFYAFLNRVLGDEITFVLFDLEYHDFNFNLLSRPTLDIIGLVFSALIGLWILFLFYKTCTQPKLKHAFLLLSLLILPSHIVWKHYYIFFLPLFILMLIHLSEGKNKKDQWVLLASVLLFNFTSFDFIGIFLAARVEGYSLLLWVYLFLFGTIFFQKNGDEKSPLLLKNP